MNEDIPIKESIKSNRSSVALSVKGSHTQENQDRFFPPDNSPSLGPIIQLVCDGITGDQDEKEKKAGLAWANFVVDNLPSEYEAMRKDTNKPEFKINGKQVFTEGNLNEVLGKLIPVNVSAITVLRYPPLFLSPQAGNYPFLALREVKIALGINGHCVVPVSFEGDNEDYYNSVEKNKQFIEGIVDEANYVDFEKLAALTLEEIQGDPQKYVQHIFPSEDVSLEAVNIIRAIEKISEKFGSEFKEQFSNINGGTTVTGALEAEDEVLIFTLGDSRTAVSVDGTLVALTGSFNTIDDLSSFVGFNNGKVHYNDGANISLLRLPKSTALPPGKINLSRLKEDDPFKVWLDKIKRENTTLRSAASQAIEGSTSDDDKTVVITEFGVGNRIWRIISFTDGVFNPPPAQSY